MKIQEINRSQSPATVAWSTIPQHSSLLAAGTVAGTLGLDFDTSAHLEIFSIDLTAKDPEEKVLGRTSAADRFHKIAWSPSSTPDVYPYGLIAGGLANGAVNIWDPAKIIEGEEGLLSSCEKHSSGPVQGLDFNPFQANLLASGGGDAEIFIWDLKNPKEPTAYNPGTKGHAQQEVPITCVAWNRKVQHILGSTNYSGTTAIWDLKAKRSVLSFSDPNRKVRCRAMAWNPEEGTQLITASEDDSNPSIAVWDLRNTYSPTKYLTGHTAGVWALSWSPMDADLLLSTGKDAKTFCWNVREGIVVAELDRESSDWNFDVQWSPRVPALLATTSLEGPIKVLSLQNGTGAASGSTGSSGLQGVQDAPSAHLSHPPRWLKRPVGAVFAFGGKILSFKQSKDNKPQIVVTQVVTDAELLERADRLEAAMNDNESLKKFCDEKISAAASDEDKDVWSLLRALFDENQREQILSFLGYSPEEVKKELDQFLETLPKLTEEEDKPEEKKKEEKKGEEEEEKKGEEEEEEEKKEGEEEEAKEEEKPEESSEKEKDASGLISGSTEEFLALAKKSNEGKETNVKYIDTEGVEGYLTKALLVGDFAAAVECCLRADRMGEALILAAYGGPTLWERAQRVFLQRRSQESQTFARLLSAVVEPNLPRLVATAALSQWRAVTAVLCSYAPKDQLAPLCRQLGQRLANADDPRAATLCFLCAGALDQTVQLWEKAGKAPAQSQSLPEVIERLAVYRRALAVTEPLTGALAEQFSRYAVRLSQEGRVAAALRSLHPLSAPNSPSDFTSPHVWQDRLFHALPTPDSSLATPPFPFERQELRSPAPVQQPASQPPSRAPSHAPSHVPSHAPSPIPTGPFSPIPSGHAAPTVHRPAPPVGTPAGPPPAQHGMHHGRPGPPPPMGTVPPPPMGQMPSPAASGSHFPQTVPPPRTQQPAGPPPSFPLGAPPAGPPPTGPPTGHPPVGPPPTAVPTPMGPPPTTPMKITPPAPVGPPPTTPVGPPPSSKGTPPATPPPEKKETKEAKASAEESQLVAQSLAAFLENASGSSDAKVAKLVKDVQKRFEPLFSKLNAAELSAGVTQSLKELCQAIDGGDSRTAQSIHVSLTQNHWQELGSSLMIGIKRLIEITKGQ